MLLYHAHQSRSRESQQRLLEAGAQLLDRFSWDDISIAAVAKEANTSVGGFYARFKSKDSLLLVLHERYEKRRNDHFERFFESDIRAQPLSERITALVEAVAEWMHENRGILRTFLLRFWSRPDEFDGAFREQLGNLYGQAVALLVGDREEIGRPDPNQAAHMAVVVLAASCRDALVLKPAPNPGALEQTLSEFKQAMAEITWCYLSAATTPLGVTGEADED